ncbi:ATP-binding protein [Chitinophaga sp. RCC_12]|uniref:tetratricopeptide repeat-containing sensor histidine kinase n=1 Tax=Chitinophaga sp. RCC_12 TaxID=3239226 RepID=UPI003523C4A6
MSVKTIGSYTLLLQLSLLLACCLASCRDALSPEVPDHPGLVDAIIDSTNDLLNVGKVRESVHYFDSAFQQIHAPGPIDQWKKYGFKANFYLYYDFNLKKARSNADSMTLILKSKVQQYKPEYAAAIFVQGHVLMAERRYAEAFKRYYDGRSFARQYLDSCSYYDFTGRLGLVRYSQGQYLKAIPYLKQSLIENATCKTDDGFNKHFTFGQSTLTAIALAYEFAGMPDSAVYYYREGLAFIDRNADKYPERKTFIETARGIIYGNLGGAFVKLHQYEEAERYLKESIQINSVPDHDFQDAQTAKLKLADLYIRTSRLKAANELLDQVALFLGEKGNNPTKEGLRMRWYKIKWSYYDRSGQYLLAYPYLQEFQKAQDSVDQINAGLKDIDMDIIFKDTEQQYKLALLKKDNELKSGYLLAFVVFSLMVVIILGGVWYSLRRSKELNNKLGQKNEQLQMALRSLEQSQLDNTRIMKVVAHDLRNPIAAAVSISTLLLESKQLQQGDKEMLELMKTSSLHSLDMIADLLNMNITAAGLKKEPVEMHTLLRYCIDLLKFKSAEKQQMITLHTKETVININREKIWRVVSNIIANAIKFSPKGAVINVALHDRQDTVLISVADHGIGIPDNLKDRVFSMFTDAKRRGTSGEQSFGLGLAISRQIVEAHEGKIWFESNSDAGTTFYVELPKRS